MDIVRVDLRGLPTWERTGVVARALDGLPLRAGLTLVTEHEPRGLSLWLARSLDADLTFEPRRVGAGEWHITLQRAHAESNGVTPESVMRRTMIFRDVPAEAYESLARVSTLHGTQRGQAIVPDDEDWPFVGIVFEGVVALASGSASPRDRIYYEVAPYDIFGEAEFFDRGRSIGRIIALTKAVRYVRIPHDALTRVGTVAPEVLMALGRACAQRSRQLADALTSQATQPILARIASALVPYASPERGLAPTVLPLPSLTQAQIAASAGTVKEVAARAIAELESRELIKRQRGHIVLLDRQRLLDLVRELS